MTSKRVVAFCSLVSIMIGFTLRWLSDLFAPWSAPDEPVFLSGLCCSAVTLLLLCAFVVCLVKLIRSWEAVGHYLVGMVLLSAFVYASLPLASALLTPAASWAPESGQAPRRDCEKVRESELVNDYEQPTISQRWLDIDGDNELERWEQIEAAIGGTGYGGAVFLYEIDEPTPFWCGQVLAWNSFVPAWIRPINLDLDLTPEIWMRDADDIPSPLSAFTTGFWDFSADGTRAFDPRLTILFVLLPLRALPLFIWFIFRRKLVPSIVIAILTLLAYAIVP